MRGGRAGGRRCAGRRRRTGRHRRTGRRRSAGRRRAGRRRRAGPVDLQQCWLSRRPPRATAYGERGQWGSLHKRGAPERSF
ncbi:hypothetical protein C3486_06025 [Streptomyces sp. Ru73]|nr:hypothetical protein C3486_06025 [Streptomyces sp. Ru73]